ncbi:MAG TPA: hypothetical protein VER17_21500 [Tepidisphaeraceae bacterium]|nr:hypothetical protein [Tepidisphaeraceae bacterium]
MMLAPTDTFLGRRGFAYIRTDWRPVHREESASRGLAVPCWLVAALTAALPVGCAVGFRRRSIRRPRQLEGRCAACGYDLRATRDKCPESGAVPEVQPATVA